MSKPAAKTSSPLAKQQKNVRENNMKGLIAAIERDYNLSKNAAKKKNIEACLKKAKEPGAYLTGFDVLFAVDQQKAHIVKDDAYEKVFEKLTSQNRQLLYSRRGTIEQMTAGGSPPKYTPKTTKPKGPDREQMMQAATYMMLQPRLDGMGMTTMHQIYATIRLPERWIQAGLEPAKVEAAKKGVNFTVAFDTGSSLQTLPKKVWEAIAGVNGASYEGPVDPGTITGVTGQENRPFVKVEIAYFRDRECKEQLGKWREIRACYASTDDAHPLTGKEIYDDFAFILPKNNGALIMGTKKPAVIWEYLRRSKEIEDFRQVQQWAAAMVDAGAPVGS
ncbi:hypothetical protein J7T55_005148 [Diaporthe amygdali]|uniref:uncharacterized protein n=1 Tax=Phomopsis amygdali TaxID=1214568 RepID=UPI0022FE321A|nr:uncharacterized protein J7T55_005148 [Diaporthe amygdali]KAJ0116202.1 hypothetical protein J7T55_005148 [Diaporthe amygdali]